MFILHYFYVILVSLFSFSVVKINTDMVTRQDKYYGNNSSGFYGNMNDKEKINVWIFDVIASTFLILFFIFTYQKGVKHGFEKLSFIWSLLVCAIPVPQAGLLLTYPLKHFFDIGMGFSQAIISLIGLCVLYVFYMCRRKFLSGLSLGRFFLRIVNKKLYAIMAFSIVATISASYLIDEILDFVLYSKEQDKTKMKDVFYSKEFIINVFVFLISFIGYFIIV